MFHWMTTIASLNCAIGPPAILRAIRTIIIDAVNGSAFERTRPHIGKEIYKGVNPTFANVNAAPAVVLPVPAISIFTSGAHRTPRNPFRRHSVLSRHTMCHPACHNLLCAKTSATCARSIAQGCTVHCGLGSAIAMTKPHTASPVVQYRPSAEARIFHIDKCWHRMGAS